MQSIYHLFWFKQKIKDPLETYRWKGRHVLNTVLLWGLSCGNNMPYIWNGGWEWNSNSKSQAGPVLSHNFSSLFHRRMMTSRKVTCRSTKGLLLPSISPRWTPPSQRSCSRCPRRAGLWWFLLQCQGIPVRKRRRRSQACGRAASSMPTLMFRG